MEKEHQHSAGSYYFRIKTDFTSETSCNGLAKVKTEELAYATSYTEAENLAVALIEANHRDRYDDASYEIIKTKIPEIVFNEILERDKAVAGFHYNGFKEDADSETGLYCVKVRFFEIDEVKGKETSWSDSYYVPATSASDASNRVKGLLKNCPTDFVVRDVKFDKASVIYWPGAIQESKQTEFKAQ